MLQIIQMEKYLVDGQQRLTTLTLILIKLYNLAKELKSQLTEWISTKIVGLSGYKKQFWMYHVEHIKTMEQLFNNEDFSKINVKIIYFPYTKGTSSTLINQTLNNLRTKEKS